MKEINKAIDVLLKNQEIANELETNKPWKDHTLAMVEKIYNPEVFIGFDLVSVQPISGPRDSIKFIKLISEDYYIKKHLVKEDVLARSRDLKTRWWRGEYIEGYIDEVCKSITQELNREIIADLKNNAHTNIEKDYNLNTLLEDISEADSLIYKKSGRAASWIVTSSEGLEALIKTGKFAHEIRKRKSSLAVWQAGILNNKYTVYEDPLFRCEQMLMGFKGEDFYDSLYIYSPYVPLTLHLPLTSYIEGPQQRGICFRYSKKLLPGGNKYFAKLQFKGMKEETDTDQ